MPNLKMVQNNLWSTPNDWQQITLGDIAEWKSGGTPLVAEKAYYGGDIPWFVIGDLNDGLVTSSQKTITRLGLENSTAKIVKEGTVLIAMYGASIGKLGIAGINGATNQAIAFADSLSKDVINRYLYYYLLSMKSYFISQGKGGAQPNISLTILKSTRFLKPPFEIQEEIVKKLDLLLLEVQNSLKAIRKSKKQIKEFRQAILTAAVTGRLTEDWREKNVNNPKRKIEYRPSNTKIKVQFGLSQFEIFDLPEQWEWRQFWEVAEIRSNLVDPNKYPDYILVAPDNIERETGRLLEKKLVREIKPISAKHLFFQGQIVYSKIRPYLSKLILADFDGVCSADMYPISSRINVRYLMLFMLSKYFLDNISNLGTRTLLPKTNQEELNSVPISIPPLDEQEEIVRKVNYYFDLVSQIESQIEKAEAKVSKLTQAILAKTFRAE